MVITLESARINAGYSQKEAGELFGVHYQTIAKWEEDNTKWKNKKPLTKVSGSR